MFMRLVYLIFFVFITMNAAKAAVHLPEDNTKAVILAYHRLGEDSYDHSTLDEETFTTHIERILADGYTVMALPDIIDAIKSDRSLPQQTIGITFEGGYKSILKYAVPLLNKHELPFTIFYASDEAGSNNGQYLNWTDLKTLHGKKNITLGILPSSYSSLTQHSEHDIQILINRARTEYIKHFSNRPRLFSYPYGMFDSETISIIKKQDFDAAFGLHSGPVYHGNIMHALPRFTMSNTYGNIERFELVTRTHPLPFYDFTQTKDSIGFTLPKALSDQTDILSCFISDQGQSAINILGHTRVHVKSTRPFENKRTRINCTIPVETEFDFIQSWRWAGFLIVP